MTRADVSRALQALHCIPSSLPREEWVRAGMAAIAAGLSLDDVVEWSRDAPNFQGEKDVRAVFGKVKPDGDVTGGTLFYIAQKHGWKQERESAQQAWDTLEPARSHAYVDAKGAVGVPLERLRVVPRGSSRTIAGTRVAGWLVVPAYAPDGALQTLQFIPTPGSGKKLNLPGHPVKGAMHLLAAAANAPAEPFYVCEGVGQMWSCWQATGSPVVCAFGWGNVAAVARHLRKQHPDAGLVLVADVGKEQEASRLAREVGAKVAALPPGWPENADVNDYARKEGQDALVELLARAGAPEAPPLPFALVPFADLAGVAPVPPVYVWDGLVPAGCVTMLAAHGGAGKSYLALMLAVAVALGLPLFGIPTRRGIVAFYSAEDGAQLLRDRLARVCMGMGVALERLEGRLLLLDASDDDPTLFAEMTTGARREGATTPAYSALREFAAAKGVSFLVVDNASDAFDASEIDRARVRGFMRALARIARERDAGLLLLAHVDKGTSRKERSDTESYSGSTAWNNSARSRLFLTQAEDGALLLQHQKHNLGKLRQPLRLLWPDGGVLQLDEPSGPAVQGIRDRVNERALIRLIEEYANRGEFISFAYNGRTNAVKALSQEPTYPKDLKPAQVFDLLRKCQRNGLLEAVSYRGVDRKPRDRWGVTDGGREFAGLAAASAACAASGSLPAYGAPAAEPAACAACAPLGGVGEKSAHALRAERPARPYGEHRQ